MYMYGVDTSAKVPMWGSEDNVVKSVLSFDLCVSPGIGLRSPGLEASDFTHWAVSLALYATSIIVFILLYLL